MMGGPEKPANRHLQWLRMILLCCFQPFFYGAATRVPLVSPKGFEISCMRQIYLIKEAERLNWDSLMLPSLNFRFMSVFMGTLALVCHGKFFSPFFFSLPIY
jgi:hypothetical protein